MEPPEFPSGGKEFGPVFALQQHEHVDVYGESGPSQDRSGDFADDRTRRSARSWMNRVTARHTSACRQPEMRRTPNENGTSAKAISTAAPRKGAPGR